MTETLPQHPNGMRFSVFDGNGDMLATNEYYSVGGGFVVNEGTQFKDDNAFFKKTPTKSVSEMGRKNVIVAPLPFKTADDLLAICKEKNMSFSDIVLQNELKWRTKEEIYSGLLVPLSCFPFLFPFSYSDHFFFLLKTGNLENHGQLHHQRMLVAQGTPARDPRCQEAGPQAVQEAHAKVIGQLNFSLQCFLYFLIFFSLSLPLLLWLIQKSPLALIPSRTRGPPSPRAGGRERTFPPSPSLTGSPALPLP